jgi:alpha-tubulin suppressor-like RCC1 family protein
LNQALTHGTELTMRSICRFVVLLGACVLPACGDFTEPSPTVTGPQFAISDAVYGSGNSGFYFLSPMVRNPTVSGTFDPNVNAAVRICAWTGTACGAELATFTRGTGSSGQVISVDPVAGAYMVRWFTRDFAVDPGQIYRIRVLGGLQELGFADVQVVLNNREAKNVNTGEFIPLVDGHILTIRFRVEQGALSAPGGTLATGNFHTCALALNGAAYCWGFNSHGQLGNGTTTDAFSPTAVSGGHTFVRLAAGGESTCGLTVTGTAYCWGGNYWGQLGTGSISGPGDCIYVGQSCSTTPVPVATSLAFTAITAGELSSEPNGHTCGLTASGMGYCWGSNWIGSLGIGLPATTSFVPTPTALTGSIAFVALVAGEDHTCGLTAGGIAYCWGGANEELAQLGNGGGDRVLTPTAVIGGLTFSALDAGYGTTCGLTAVGAGYCWGNNSLGQLGIGPMDSRVLTPTAIVGGLTFAALTLGYDHSCGLTASGVAYCWGNNYWGALGTGNTAGVSSPIEVSGGLKFVVLSAGGDYTCGLTASGLAYCWGFNDAGQVGDGTTNTALVPVSVGGGFIFRTP